MRKLELQFKCKSCGFRFFALGHEDDQEFLQDNAGEWPDERLPLSIPMNLTHKCPTGVIGILDIAAMRVVEK